MPFLPWLFALASTAVCLYLWFREVRRIMRARKSTVESAAGQLISCRNRALDVPHDPELDEVLARSENIYQQGLDLYHDTLGKMWVKIPAKFLGFSPLDREGYLCQLAEQRSGGALDPDEQPIFREKVQSYIGSVRFFKNLILLTVVILILIPTLLAFRFERGLRKTEEQLQRSGATEEELRDVIGDLVLQSREQEKELEKYDRESAQLKARLQEALSEKEWTQSESEEQGVEKIEVESPYAELYPDFCAPQALNASVRESKVIYLTFDDGPSDRTGEVLDILKEKGVKATFFVVGTNDKRSHDMLRRIVEEGHTLGMHTYSHDYSKIYASVEDYLADMYQIFRQIEEVTGVTPTLFRFPGGSINGYNSAIYQELVSEMMRRGFVPFDWNLSNADAAEKPVPAETLISNVITGARIVDRGVVLMHDSAPRITTVEALGTIIDELRGMGFELKALTPEVMPLLYAYKN